MQNSVIRPIVASMDHELSTLSAAMINDQGRASAGRLNESWKHLVDALAMAPEPTRLCPKCGNLGMQAATVCGYCWTKLAPLEPSE